MSKEELENFGYYIIKVQDGDRYLREVYASDEVIHISNTKEEAEEYLNKLIAFIEK